MRRSVRRKQKQRVRRDAENTSMDGGGDFVPCNREKDDARREADGADERVKSKATGLDPETQRMLNMTAEQCDEVTQRT